MWANFGKPDMSGGKLTVLKLKALTSPGRYGDGNGLWLQVRDATHRSWLFRYTVGGRARQMGLGRFPEVSLAEARDAAGECRAVARKDLDPIEERRKVRSANRQVGSNVTFKQVADRYISVHETSWCNAKHRYQWRQTLGLACGEIGKTAVAEISTGDVMRVLEPIWREKTETASRLRGRIESVLDYAAAHGWRGGENPARWRGHLAKLLPAPSKIAQVEHHPALPWQQIGRFMTELHDHEGIAARALEFTILTAARTGEAIGGRILELNTQAAVWTVPASRMKSKRIHRVPLSQPAMMVLDKVAPLGIGGPETRLFPGGKSERPLSGMAMIMLLRRMGHTNSTVHGFRSTFRDWCAEATDYPREVAEAALAHVLADKVEAGYRRGDLFEKRRRLMEEWARFCIPTPNDAAEQPH